MPIDVYEIMLKVKVFCHRWSPLTTTTDDLDDASQRSRIAQRLVSVVKANVSVSRADVSSRSWELTSRALVLAVIPVLIFKTLCSTIQYNTKMC